MRHSQLGSLLKLAQTKKKSAMLKTEGADLKSLSHHYKCFDWSLCSRWKSSLTQPPVDTAAVSTPRPPPQIAFHGLKVAEKGPRLPSRARLALISHGAPRWGQIVVTLFTLQRTGHSRVYSSLLSTHTKDKTANCHVRNFDPNARYTAESLSIIELWEIRNVMRLSDDEAQPLISMMNVSFSGGF